MLHILESADTLLSALADFVVTVAKESIKTNDRFSFVLSGGSSPKKLHQLLASDKYRNKIDWNKVYFFFGDERYVPADHADSNYLMAKNTLFNPLQIKDDHIFRMNTDLTPAEAAIDYEKKLKTYFTNQSVRFDLILLGLGDNSHTASLFPHTSVLHEKEMMVKEIYVDEVKMFRITLTAPCINQAANIAFLVFGVGKAEAVKHILEDESNIEEYPAQLIKPLNGQLHWFMDMEAASRIKK
jgi:6-phosphogluconolactonase